MNFDTPDAASITHVTLSSLGSVTHTITSYVNDHGIYAVFILMAIDAVFPAASELVMIYAGALASGVPRWHRLGIKAREQIGPEIGHSLSVSLVLRQ